MSIHAGSCWAFSTVAAMEGITQLKTGNLTSLSAQELVDCDSENEGCMYGYIHEAFYFIIQSNGLSSEANYPYTGVNGVVHACKGHN